MPVYPLKSGLWQARVRRKVNDKHVSKSKNFPTKKLAVAWEARVLADIDSVKYGTSSSRTFADLKDELSTTYLNKYARLRLKSFTSYFGPYRLDHITKDVVHTWIKERGEVVKPSTINRELNQLSSFFNEAVRLGWIKINPVHGVDRPKNPKHRTRRPSSDEIERLVLLSGWPDSDTLQSLTIGYFLGAIETGMRLSEIHGLDASTVHFDERYAHLIKTKNGDERLVPLTDEALPIFELLVEKKQKWAASTSETISSTFARLCKKTGIEGLVFHDSRHEAASRLAGRMNATDLALWFGWKHLKYAMVYYQATPAEMLARLKQR